MNSFLLSLGIAFALVLIAAFAAPFFIDWSSYRTYFEARAGEIIGRPVVFDGDLSVRLVPYPSLTAKSVRIGGPNSGEGIERIEMRAALTPLLSGELQVTEFTLTRPDVILRLDTAGRIDWANDSDPTPPIHPDRITLDRVEIVDGSFTVEDERSGDIRYLSDVNLVGSATSLLGPFKAEGGGLLDGERYTVRLATGRAMEDGSGMRVKLSILPAARPLDIALDGALLRIEGMPVFDGRLSVERVVPEEDRDESAEDPATWKLDGLLTASAESLVLDKMSIRFGTEVRNVSLAGAANVRLGADPRFDAVVSARQIDFDRAFGSGPDSPVSAQAAMGQISGFLDPDIFPLPGHLALDVDSIVLSGGLLEGLSVDVELDGDIWSVERATITAPGQTGIGVAGTVGLGGETPVFEGAVRLDTDQATVFANWLFGAQTRLPSFAIPAGRMEASGQVRIDATGLGLERVDVNTGNSEIEGSLAYRPAPEGGRGAVAVALFADRLAVPDGDGATLGGDKGLLGAVEALLAGLDFDLQLRTETLVLGAIEAQNVALNAAIADGDARIAELAIGDLGGARISGEGDVLSYAKAPDGDMRLGVTASSFAGVVEALNMLGSPVAAQYLADRADVLVPADLTADVKAAATDDGNSIALELAGTLGGTVLDARFDFDGRLDEFYTSTVDLSLRADNPDGSRLARQIGLVAPEASVEAGSLTVEAQGLPRDAMRFSMESAGIGLEGSVAGSARWPPGGGREVTGEFALDIADTEAMLGLAGIVMPSVDRTALTVSAALSGTDDIWRLSDLEAGNEDGVVRGELTFDLGGEERIIGGKLEADRIELAWLMDSLLGPQATAFPDVPQGEPAWPSVALAPVEKPDWRGRIALTTPTFGLFDGLVLTEAEAEFSFDSARISLDGLKGNAFGGRMVAGVDLVDTDGVLSLSGRADISDARLEEFVWHGDGRAIATGAVWAGMEFTGQGRSLAAITSSLSGTGSFRVVDGVLRRFNPNAFDQIVSAADAGLELTEQKVRDTFAAHLDAGSLQFQSMEGAFSISSGVLRASNIRIDTDDLKSFASATVDLSILGIDSEWTLQVTDEEDGGRSREVGVIFSGPIAAPSRSIDVNPLLGFLTVRAFEQEVERLENLQAEILERQRLGRELIRQGQERARREREAIERENQARAAEENARKSEEEAQQAEQESQAEEARRAEEDARQAEERRRAEEEARQAEERRRAEEEARQAEEQRRAEDEARRRADEEALRAAEERARQRAEEERRRVLQAPPDSSGSAISVEPLGPPQQDATQVQPQQALPARQPQGSSVTTLDDGEFRRRIEDLLRDIPSAAEGPQPTGGVMAREPSPQPYYQLPGTQPSASNSPLVISPQGVQPVPQVAVPQVTVPQAAAPQLPTPQFDPPQLAPPQTVISREPVVDESDEDVDRRRTFR